MKQILDHHQSLLHSILDFFFHYPQPQPNPDLINSLVHELKTPLNAVLSYSEMLQKDIRNPLSASDCIDYAKEINQATHGLNELVNDLLDVGAIRSRNFSVNLENRIDVADVIKRSIRLNYAYALKRQIRIESEAENLEMKLDEKRMKQVLTNLISNSVKYSPDNSLIRVIARKENDSLVIKVIDQGFGMSDLQVAQAFEKYRTIENPNSGKVDSFGLGLPIAKELVELQGGRIQMKSELNKGTEVELRFPNLM